MVIKSGLVTLSHRIVINDEAPIDNLGSGMGYVYVADFSTSAIGYLHCNNVVLF